MLRPKQHVHAFFLCHEYIFIIFQCFFFFKAHLRNMSTRVFLFPFLLQYTFPMMSSIPPIQFVSFYSKITFIFTFFFDMGIFCAIFQCLLQVKQCRAWVKVWPGGAPSCLICVKLRRRGITGPVSPRAPAFILCHARKSAESFRKAYRRAALLLRVSR